MHIVKGSLDTGAEDYKHQWLTLVSKLLWLWVELYKSNWWCHWTKYGFKFDYIVVLLLTMWIRINRLEYREAINWCLSHFPVFSSFYFLTMEKKKIILFSSLPPKITLWHSSENHCKIHTGSMHSCSIVVNDFLLD